MWPMPNLINLVGKTFGRLTVFDREPRTMRRGNARWRCKCVCGTENIVSGDKLMSGHTQSCGCLGRDITRQRNAKHGAAFRKQVTREYRAWCDMKTRCRRD